MPYDFKNLLNVPKNTEASLLTELNETEWARYGRNVHALMFGDRFVKAIQTMILNPQDGPEAPSVNMARRLRIFLTTGVIAK
jgi:hypothetical protein